MDFEGFVNSEYTALAQFTGALTGDVHAAEDVLADVLLKVSDRWSKIAAMDRPSAYVRRMIVTTLLSDRRKAARRRTDPSGDDRLLDRAVPDGSEQVIDRDEVQRLLSRLSPKQRAVIVLKYLADWDDKKISEALNCSPATVRSQASQARATLRLSDEAPIERH